MIRRPPRSTLFPLHDALPISLDTSAGFGVSAAVCSLHTTTGVITNPRSEEHTSELQSQSNLVCRLLLEKKKKKNKTSRIRISNKHSTSSIMKYSTTNTTVHTS